MPLLPGTRFGDIEFADADVIQFEQGLIGFDALKRFLLIPSKEGSAFAWLQSIDEPTLSFLVTDPALFVDEYEPILSENLRVEMRLLDATPRLLLTTVSIPHGRPEQTSLNLAGPILINVQERIGRQFVVENEAYTIKYRVFSDSEIEERPAA